MSKKYSRDSQLSILDENVISFEKNIWSLPIFSTNKKDVGTQKIIDIKIRTKRGEGRWRVIPDAELGTGGPFDDKVLAAIMKVLSDMAKPLQNPIDLGSLGRIRRIVYPEMRTFGGETHADIKNSLRRLTRLTLSSTYCFYDKESSKYLAGAEGEFHFLDIVVFKDEKLSTGEVADSNYVWLGSHILRNLNRRYAAPVDFEFYMRLSPDSAKSLFRILSSSFYAVGGRKSVRYRYSTLIERAVLTPFTKESRAQQQLAAAIQSLISHKYIKDSIWSKIPGEKRDWYIEFWPGKLAEEFANTKHPRSEGQPAGYIEGEAITDYVQEREDEKSLQLLTNELLPFQKASIEALLDSYKSLFEKRFGHPPLIDGLRERDILAQIAATYDGNTISHLLKLFIYCDDEFVKKTGYTLPVFKSVIQKLIVEKGRGRKERPLSKPQQEELIDKESFQEGMREVKESLRKGRVGGKV